MKNLDLMTVEEMTNSEMSNAVGGQLSDIIYINVLGICDGFGWVNNDGTTTFTPTNWYA